MKAIIPAAGLGTRLLPATKEQPKEMLSVFALGVDGGVCVKPLLQLVFEQLYDVGFREFCFVIGRGKRAIEDHFTPDNGYAAMLKSRGKSNQALDLEAFYRKLEDSTMIWVNQPEPRGFGDAVLKARFFAGDEATLVHAGDTYIMSDGNRHLERLMRSIEELGSDAALIVQEIEDPRQYGIIEGEEIDQGTYRVRRAVEKPMKPATNLAIMPVYIFTPVIFKALEVTPPGVGGEIQLTDAIQRLIDWGLKVHARKLRPEEARLDIGTTEAYWEALRLSYQHVSNPVEKP